MKTILTLLAAVALVGMTGVVQAEPAKGPDESTHTLDYVAALGKTYFIKCRQGTSLLDCKGMSLWEQSNGYPGLQTSYLKVGDGFQADTLILS